MAVWPFQRSRARKDAERLLGAVTLISRQPAFFGEGRAADTLEGRFEVMALHGALALIRLRADPGLEPLAQEFTDAMFSQFDAGLREASVGDMAVPRRMRRLASAFYGRLEVYGGALDAADSATLTDALSRNLLKDEAARFAAVLADYAKRTVEHQANLPVDALFRLDGWAPAPA